MHIQESLRPIIAKFVVCGRTCTSSLQAEQGFQLRPCGSHLVCSWRGCLTSDGPHGLFVYFLFARESRLGLQEQRRWLFYDAYARICMALGRSPKHQRRLFKLDNALKNRPPSHPGRTLQKDIERCQTVLMMRERACRVWCGASTSA